MKSILFSTKALVLELLAAICLVKGGCLHQSVSRMASQNIHFWIFFPYWRQIGGHEIILESFNRFKDICSEKRRFQTLMGYFMNYEMFHIEFMVACTQVIADK